MYACRNSSEIAKIEGGPVLSREAGRFTTREKLVPYFSRGLYLDSHSRMNHNRVATDQARTFGGEINR